MVIRIPEKFRKICWTVLIIQMVDYFGGRAQLIFFFSIAAIIMMCITGRKIVRPELSGMRLYAIAIVVMMCYGLFFFEPEKYTKGVYHILPSVIVMVLGYYICYVYPNKSLVLTSAVTMILMLIHLVYASAFTISSISGLDDMRNHFSGGASLFLFLLAIVMNARILNKRIILGKRIDIILIIIGIIRIVISLNRSTIMAFVVSTALMGLSSIFINRKNAIRRTLILLATTAALMFLAFSLLPSQASNEFFDKVDNSSKEINSEQEFSSGSDVLKNWRGYEISKAKKQWLNYNFVEMIIGGGIQKYTKMEDLPRDMKENQESMVNNESPILHNGYYTLLVKGGLLAVIGYIVFLIYPLYAIIRKKTNAYNKEILITLIGINAIMAVLTYVVRGMISQSVLTTYALSVGWLSCRLYNQKDNENQEVQESEVKNE
ncbi:MAG: O-antigen ligase family protein [Eubacterium sp.]|nr:O-antigen ligase family protein [Eubacterium sp.]